MARSPSQFGALGDWKKISIEPDDTISKQIDDSSCVAAVGEMLASFYGLSYSQAEILAAVGHWSNAAFLANFLNSKETAIGIKWIGGAWDAETSESALKWLVQNNHFGAMLRNKSAEGHAVYVGGMDSAGLVLLSDPFDQTRYKMMLPNFAEVLSEIVWRKVE